MSQHFVGRLRLQLAPEVVISLASVVDVPLAPGSRTLQGPEEEVALAPEGGVEPIAARSRATHQVIQPGVAVAMAPKLLQGAIEGFGRFEVLGSWHVLTS